METLLPWIEQQKASLIIKFIENYVASADLDDENKLERLSDSLIAEAIKTKDDADQSQLLHDMPEAYLKKLILEQFAGSDVYSQFVEEWWNTHAAEMPYVVFDLETDGETIEEFAFLKDGNTRTYEAETQLNSLARAIQRTPIVVGHNVKEWDLPVLEKKGITTDKFVWDTLEIEILLNPCRYTYSLLTKHNAKDDTELTNSLFWNQLYRLSQDRELCESLKDFLPREINSLLVALQQDMFAEHFKKSASLRKQFFQKLRELDADLNKKLKEIAKIKSGEPTLIIAPRTFGLE